MGMDRCLLPERNYAFNTQRKFSALAARAMPMRLVCSWRTEIRCARPQQPAVSYVHRYDESRPGNTR
eukprot:scaffold1708_cov117-Isochrysis_galbana.AAC.12